MVYEFRCAKCDFLFDVVRSVSEFSRSAQCTQCGNMAELQVSRNKNLFSVSGIPESPEFNPGLGCVVKSGRERKELAKRKGLIEVGTEKVESVHAHFDNAREERLKKSWEDV